MPADTSSDEYETEHPNDYRWTELAFKGLTEGRMKAEISGAGNARRALVSGPCPRCTHELNFDQLLNTVAGEDGTLVAPAISAREAERTSLELVVSCRCGETHEKRPKGVDVGCGINFCVELLEPPTNTEPPE